MNKTNIEELMINREDSFIFHQLNILPTHSLIIETIHKNKWLDYSLMNDALDKALEWTYYDLKEHPELAPDMDFLSPIQDNNEKETKDIEVIKLWLEKRNHQYYDIKNSHLYTTDDCEKFPFRYLKLEPTCVYLGFNPIIPNLYNGLINKQSVKYFGKEELVPKKVLEELKIEEDEWNYIVPFTWYTKDAQPLVKLFGKNFAMNYNNLTIEKKYKK